MTTNQLYKALYACQSAHCWDNRIAGIRYEPGYLCATDGHIIAVVPFDTPPEKVGKTLRRDGSINCNIYPSIDAISKSDTTQVYDVDFDSLLKACSDISPCCNLLIIGMVLNPVFVFKAALLLKLFGNAGTIEAHRECVVLRCGDAWVSICGHCGLDGLSIEEACILSI